MFPHFKPKYGPLFLKFLKNCIHAQIRETVFVQFNFKEILLYYTVTGEAENKVLILNSFKFIYPAQIKRPIFVECADLLPPILSLSSSISFIQ